MQQHDAATGNDVVLKRCPFCGASDSFVERADFSSCYVVCNSCGARGPTSCDENAADAEASENGDAEPGEMPARRYWDTRAPGALIERLTAGEGEAWRVNPETPSVIITPYGRISINWAASDGAGSLDCSQAETTAAMIVAAVNARLTAQPAEGELRAALKNAVYALEFCQREAIHNGSAAACTLIADYTAEVLPVFRTALDRAHSGGEG